MITPPPLFINTLAAIGFIPVSAVLAFVVVLLLILFADESLKK